MMLCYNQVVVISRDLSCSMIMIMMININVIPGDNIDGDYFSYHHDRF